MAHRVGTAQLFQQQATITANMHNRRPQSEQSCGQSCVKLLTWFFTPTMHCPNATPYTNLSCMVCRVDKHRPAVAAPR
jgi:hypothetical protein